MEALIVCKTPMEDIQLHRLHPVQIALNCVDGYKPMSGVNQQSTPGETWRVIDRNDGNTEAFRSDSHQLQKRLQSADDTNGIGRLQLNIGLYPSTQLSAIWTGWRR